MNVINASSLVSPVIPTHPSSPDGNWVKAFPFQSFLELGAYREAAASARGHARNVLAEWGLGHLADAVTHVLSELTANSVNATEKVAWQGGRPPVRMWLLGGGGPSGAGEVLVCVWDAVREVPVPRVAGEADESGRGLGIVGALAGRWDCYLPDGPEGGKVTRAWIDSPWRDQPSA